MNKVLVKSSLLLGKPNVLLAYAKDSAVIHVPGVCKKREVSVDRGVITFIATGLFLTKLVRYLTLMDIEFKIEKGEGHESSND